MKLPFDPSIIDISSFAQPYQPISNYGIIGNCRTAALVSASGSIDWLCLPRFDSPSFFGAILDARRGGRFSITPRDIVSVRRAYAGETNVLETTFTTTTGTLRLTDLMPVFSEQEKRMLLVAQHEVLRKVECLDGAVHFDLLYHPGPMYGAMAAVLEDRHWMGWTYNHRDQVVVLGTNMPLRVRPDRSALEGNMILRAGEIRWFSMTFTQGEPAVLPTLGQYAEERVRHTLTWWNNWSAQCTYRGRYREEVIRSALALKLLAFAPSGALVAAPTTSLPESPGGIRNWDYRFCWLRDASQTVRALLDLGYTTEARAYLSWVLHTTWATQPELQVLYGVYGEPNPDEQIQQHLEGYLRSSPVRTGNDARSQLQLDIYGEVVLATYEDILRGGDLDRSEQRLFSGIADLVCRRWREPDEGIWEIRSGRRHHTYSKSMCWVALDRLIKLHESGLIRINIDKLTREREAIRDAIEQHGYNESLQSYVNEFDGADLDASLLLLSINGYCDPLSPRMRSTVKAILHDLSIDGLVYRYRTVEDGLPPGENAFGICALWAVQALLLEGAHEEASARFGQFLRYSNDLHLYSEEIEPKTGRHMGNFPQAFTHLGLIDAAFLLEQHALEGRAKTVDRGTVQQVGHKAKEQRRVGT